MALTKLPKNAFGTGSVDSDKIEDGTIQNQEISGTLPEEKLATGTIENASLSNSTITINGTSISLGGSSSVGVDVNWQSVITGAGSSSTAVAGNGYFIDTTSNTHTLNLPASATLGDQIAIKDYAGTFASNNLTIGRNGHNIQGVANDSLISTNRASLLLVYVDSTKGWIYAEESNVADLQVNTFISATGGTITTSGDFKIHTFTGDGCFVVSTTGAGPAGGPADVDYVIVAGGGGGAAQYGGGGGAGGYRESHSTPVSGCYSASPLATPTGITVSATTYPVTVGAGGAGPAGACQPNPVPNAGSGSAGSNSVFSTITSAGGGGTPPGTGGAGGSGGGATNRAAPTTSPGGAGNTPPVSPPQGNPGGLSGWAAGGGGGAGAAGGGTQAADSPNPTGGAGGPGGNGVTSSITGSPVTRAGGGGGGTYRCTVRAPGGSGGGGRGALFQVCGCGSAEGSLAGTANTGGGGGGGAAYATGKSGGKGIVIIRYKFQ